MDETQPLINDRIQRDFDRVAVGCILVFQGCERFVYFSIVTNQITLTESKLDLSLVDGVYISLLFTGCGYFLTILGGIVSDTVAGKYYTIFGSGVLYLIGTILYDVAGADYKELFKFQVVATDSKKILAYLSLVIIGIASGGVNANLGPLGAEQIEHLGPRAIEKFFSSFYWVRNLSAIIVVTVIAFIQTSYFGVGILISIAVMAVGLVVLFLGRNRYITPNSTGSVLFEAVCICFVTRCRGICISYENGQHYPEESLRRTRALVKILPTFGFAILYWTLYSQMQSTYFIQAGHMDLKVGGETYFPVSFLNCFNVLSVLVLIPVMELCVYPVLDTINMKPSLLVRIGIGMLLAALSVLASGIVEQYRKKDVITTKQSLLGATFNASTLSVFAQVPQFSLFGTSEVFTSVAGLVFAYTEAPRRMKGMCMGLFIATHGLGSFVAVIIDVVVRAAFGSDVKESWFSNDINNGNMENLFFLLAGLMSLNIIFFVISSSFYRYGHGRVGENH